MPTNVALNAGLIKLIRTGYNILRDSVPSLSNDIIRAICRSQDSRARCTRDDNWGELRVFPIESGNDFWSLIAELYDDNSDFVENKNTLVEAYRNGNLYGIEVDETQAMYDGRRGPIFVKGGLWLLPCLCVVDGDEAVIMWTHSRARRNGFGRAFVEQLGIKTAHNRLEGSQAFWDACLPQ